MLCRACDVFRSSEAAAVALEEMRFDARHVQLGLDAPQAHRRMTGGAGPAQHPEGGRTVGPARNSMGHGRTHVSCWGGKKLAVLTPQRVSPTWRARGIAPAAVSTSLSFPPACGTCYFAPNICSSPQWCVWAAGVTRLNKGGANWSRAMSARCPQRGKVLSVLSEPRPPSCTPSLDP
jgi:hypothetical protein